MELILAAATLGFLGSAHCAGMCGGFFVLAGKGRAMQQSLYLFGKTLSYAILGLAAGMLGAGAAMIMPFRTALSISIGILFIVIGLSWAGALPTTKVFSSIQTKIASRFGRILRRSGRGAPLAVGLANGLLPCGLLYGGLALAASSSGALLGAATMASFGLGTIPGLVVFGVVARSMSHSVARHSHLVGGILMVVFGIITLSRAFAMTVHGVHQVG